MNKIEDFLPFVKSQGEFHERQALRFSTDKKRSELHNGTANSFIALHDLLSQINNLAPQKTLSDNALSLSWSELNELPKELVAELSITESDKLDFSIMELIEKCGGMASLDRILVEIYKLTGEILKRANLNARLYRMSQKGMIYSVQGKKGVYSTGPVEENQEPEKIGIIEQLT